VRALACHCRSDRQSNGERKIPEKIGRHASRMMVSDSVEQAHDPSKIKIVSLKQYT
jgi:hypothetical protein